MESGFLDLESLEVNQRFDFLEGKWTYQFSGGRGETEYRKADNGTAIHETLTSAWLGEQEFSAVSLFFFDEEAQLWRQRWLDTLGNQLDGSGGIMDSDVSELPVMQLEFEHQGSTFRHLWYDIREDRFETDLLISSDGGKTFALVRRMGYERVDGES